MGIWSRDEWESKRDWAEKEMAIIEDLNKVYDKVKQQKDNYNSNVKKERKDLFKDGWFQGDYKWQGEKFQQFNSLGTGTVKDEVDDYYWSWSDDGLDNLLSDLNREIGRRRSAIFSAFTSQFGLLDNFYVLLDRIYVEIQNLVD